MLQDNIKDLIIRSLNASLQSKKLYPSGHPSVINPLKKTLQMISDFVKDKTKFSIAFAQDTLIVEGIPLDGSEENYPDLISYLKGQDIEAIIFEKGINEKELTGLVEILTAEKVIESSEINNELQKRGIIHITLKSIQKKKDFVKVYNDAIGVVKHVMDDIRMGKIPRSNEVKKVVTEVTELVFADTNAMIGLTMIKDYDNYLYNHSVNVSILSLAMGKFLNLDEESLKALGIASLLHDIGKTGVSEDIIKKPGGLSSEEWEKIKEHPVLGSKITTRMEGLNELITRIIFEHHVRYDGSGYPKVEKELHPLSMIVSVADAYDALTTIRVYQRPYQPVEAIKVLRGLAGKHFDPKTVKNFENMIGVYPVGTAVRLSTNEVGIVTKINPSQNDRPCLKILYDGEGNILDNPFYIDLSEKSEGAPLIIGHVDPLARNMDLGSFFVKEAG